MSLADATLIDILSYAVLAIAIGLLVAAAVIDIRRFVIPNWVNASLLATGLVYATLHYGSFAWGMNVILLVTTFLVGALLYQLRFLGGGDVKLFAVLSFWSGIELVFPLLLITAAAGGLLSVVYLVKAWLRKGNTPEQRSVLNEIATQAIVTVGSAAAGVSQPVPAKTVGLMREPVPYGVAIAVGGVYVFLSIAGHLGRVVN